QFFHSEAAAWTGVLFCLAGLLILLWSLISFKQSFRVGIDTDRPDKLIVDGIFAFSRNPIYLAFAMVLIGEFLIFPNWITFDPTPEADTANGHRAEMRCPVVCSARQQLTIVERNHSSLAEIARVERSCEVVAARYLGATSTKPARAARMRS